MGRNSVARLVKSTVIIALFMMVGLLLTGCTPGRRSTGGDRPSPEGTWGSSKFLIRSYPGLSMQNAIKAALATAKNLNWEEDDDDYGRHVTSLEYEDEDGTELIIRIWVPADGAPTEVGIQYDGKKRVFVCPEFLDQFEQTAGVKQGQ